MPTKKKQTQRKQKVLVSFIQDRSGSMSANWQESIAGFAAFVKDLQIDKAVKYVFSLTVFDTNVDEVYVSRPIAEIDPEELAQYWPRGWTALYDAVGQSLQSLDKLASDVDKVICLVVTDGAENASHKYSKNALHSLVDAYLKTGKYTFQYLGTQPETWADAAAVGFAAGQTMIYDNSNTRCVYSVLSGATRSFAKDAMHTASLGMVQSYTDTNLIADAGIKFSKQNSAVTSNGDISDN